MITSNKVTNIAARHAGDAEAKQTIVFLHAMAGSAIAWDSQLESLSDTYACVAWDMPGFGDSDDPKPDADMSDMVKALAKFVHDDLSLENAHFVGLSVGGMILQHFAARYPALCRSLTIMDSSPKFGFGGDMKPSEFATPILAQLAGRISVEDFSFGMVGEIVAKDCSPEHKTQAIKAMSRARMSGLALTTRLIADHDALHKLSGIACPVLALTGEHDAETPMSYADEIAQRVQNGSSAVIAGAGHISNIENPQEVTRLLRAFLNAQS